MFPSRLYSSLNLICIFEKEEKKTSRLRSARSGFTSSRSSLLCMHSVDRKHFFIHETWLPCNVQLPSSDIVVAVFFASTARLRNRDIFIVAALSQLLPAHGE